MSIINELEAQKATVETHVNKIYNDVDITYNTLLEQSRRTFNNFWNTENAVIPVKTTEQTVEEYEVIVSDVKKQYMQSVLDTIGYVKLIEMFTSFATIQSILINSDIKYVPLSSGYDIQITATTITI